MPPSRLLVVLALGLVAGCSKTATAPRIVNAPLPPGLVATQPAAWATGVLYDSDIWGQFERGLDPATVGTTTVYLKLDGQRIPVTVTYEPISRRVVLQPTVTLALQRTYTVEFSTGVHAADGVPLASGVFFQFTTNSLRRVPMDYPGAGVLEGPLVTLGWGGGQGPANNLFYEVYAGPDSAAVEQRAMAPLQRSVFTRFVPSEAWPAGQRVYWAITSENLATGERLHGPARAFQVLDAGLPVDSVQVLARDFGSNDSRNRNTQFCNRQTLPCGPRYNGGVHWDYAPLPPGARVVDAVVRGTLIDSEAGSFPRVQPVTAWMSQNDWTACAMTAPGPPFHELSGLLATASEASPTVLAFRSSRLGAFAEAQARGRTLVPGLVFRAGGDLTFHSSTTSTPGAQPRMTVYFQRLPAGAAP